jgi:hypothetical protein
VQYWEIGVRCMIGIIFLVSSVSKARSRAEFESFVESVRRMRLLPSDRVRLVAAGVLVAEFIAWMLLVLPVRIATVAGFSVAAGLLLVFTAAIAMTVRRGVRTSCRCLGASVTPLGPWQIVRNLLLAGAAVLAGAASFGSGQVEPGGMVVAVFAGLVLGGLVAVFDAVVELFRGATRDTAVSGLR